MYAGGNFSLIKTPNTIYSFGCNTNGELGRVGSTFEPLNIPFFVNKKVKQISCGFFHSLILTKGGEIYAFGDNSYNQLGHENEILYYSSDPVLIEFFKDMEIEKVRAGRDFSFVYCKNGKLFAFGNNDSGQLGCKNKTGIINEIFWAEQTNILEIYTGSSANHTFISVDEGYFSFGKNDSQQLGLDHSKDQYLPQYCSALENIKVKDTQLTPNKTYILTEDGKILCLGFSVIHRNNNEIEFFNDKKATIMSASGFGLIVGTKHKECYFLGAYLLDQSGYDLSEGKVVPLKINFFDGIKVLNITSGGNHSIILTEHQRVFIFGDNSWGQYGFNHQFEIDQIAHNDFFDDKNISGLDQEENWFQWNFLTLNTKNIKEFEKWKKNSKTITFHFN